MMTKNKKLASVRSGADDELLSEHLPAVPSARHGGSLRDMVNKALRLRH
jgi:hypothetical protein